MRMNGPITKKNDLMFKQILLTSSIRNIWRTVRKMCLLILESKGKQDFSFPAVNPVTDLNSKMPY